jgi:hypothetical protein
MLVVACHVESCLLYDEVFASGRSADSLGVPGDQQRKLVREQPAIVSAFGLTC